MCVVGGRVAYLWKTHIRRSSVMRCCEGVGGGAGAGQARQLPFDMLDMNEGLYVNPLRGFMTGVHLFTSMSAFWLHKDIFLLSVACSQ